MIIGDLLQQLRKDNSNLINYIASRELKDPVN